MAEPRDCVYLCTHNAAEIGDGRLAILDVAGLPEIRQWFVVRPAAKRMMPAARSLREFLVAEGRSFLTRSSSSAITSLRFAAKILLACRSLIRQCCARPYCARAESRRTRSWWAIP